MKTRQPFLSADIAMLVDELSMVKESLKSERNGCKNTDSLLFPRHMAMRPSKPGTHIMVQTCQEIGLEFVAATALDPTGEAGMSGAQQFIVDDLPQDRGVRKGRRSSPQTAVCRSLSSAES